MAQASPISGVFVTPYTKKNKACITSAQQSFHQRDGYISYKTFMEVETNEIIVAFHTQEASMFMLALP